MTDAELKALNESLARYFGWERCHPNFDDWFYVSRGPFQRGVLPNFCDIRGPWIGQILQAILDGGWDYTTDKNESPEFCWTRYPRGIQLPAEDVHDMDFGIAAGLAFAAMKESTHE